ncbi:MAG: Cell envelope-related function transcriptional attenuator common domain protein [Candidatus Woesebacteria bacterium GW2011_GWC1_43_10b]|uniref:Cell envelope-related function transcriptional attenuator common domain protein n=2 Tax=Candidatus Woeseibacteriota TaxID=1752722 RepID=A0A0G1IR64_9BACT|nr:MAG: Cell envelope-related function transcriptional attenuator common domain protein [Candidatus Woesebacteria bacterium GW2011_GWC1_43_10b]KKT34262.1 MAG: Cell envelope-related function transcriptional attenuator common domain protein [Candidatus Woesebacteria bacterium GW2011_GWB1_44_11b]
MSERLKPVVEEMSGDFPEEALKTVDSVPPEMGEPTGEPPKKRGSFKIIIITALVTATIVALLAGGIYVYLTGTNSISKIPEEPTPTPTPIALEPEVIPTPLPEEVDLSEFDVNILNGSGKIGEAGKVRGLIEKAGFNVVNTGNAKTFDFKETIIQAGEDVPQAVVDAAQKALEEDYAIKIGETLPSSSNYDLVITVGSL